MVEGDPILLWSSPPNCGLRQSSQNAHGKATWIGAYNPTKHLAATLPIKKSALARSYHTIMGWLQYLQNYRDDCSISDKAVWELQVNGIS